MLLPVKTHRSPARLHVVIGPNRFAAITLLVIGTLGFLVLLAMPLALFNAQGTVNPGALPFLAPPLLAVLASILVAYQRTEVVLDSRCLSWKRGPFLQWIEFKVGRQELRGFRLEKNVEKGDEGRRRVSYTLLAESAAAGSPVIVKGLSKKAGLALVEDIRRAKEDLHNRPPSD